MPVTLQRLERLRHRVPFWWWLTYDALVAIVIVAGVSPSDPAFWLGFAVLSIAVAIDLVEFVVKRPGARARLAELEDAGL
jgi:hypothetical protein